jgi:hypothetical protein
MDLWQAPTRKKNDSHAADPCKGIRMLTAVSLLVLFWVALAATRWGSDNSRLQAASTANIQPIVVRAGDTLWQLAIDHGPQGVDPRRTIDTIRRINNLSDSDLRPGAVLHIPDRRNQLL